MIQARQDGLSWHAIRERVTENGKQLPLSTIQMTVKRNSSRSHFKSLPRSGRPKKISEDDLKKILAEIEKAPDSTMRDLHISLCPFVSEATFPVALQEAG
jgi:transposase